MVFNINKLLFFKNPCVEEKSKTEQRESTSKQNIDKPKKEKIRWHNFSVLHYENNVYLL